MVNNILLWHIQPYMMISSISLHKLIFMAAPSKVPHTPIFTTIRCNGELRGLLLKSCYICRLKICCRVTFGGLHTPSGLGLALAHGSLLSIGSWGCRRSAAGAHDALMAGLLHTTVSTDTTRQAVSNKRVRSGVPGLGLLGCCSVSAGRAPLCNCSYSRKRFSRGSYTSRYTCKGRVQVKLCIHTLSLHSNSV